jgi:hypothetical protein
VSALVHAGRGQEAAERVAELNIPGTDTRTVMALVSQKLQELHPPASDSRAGTEIQLDQLLTDLRQKEKLSVDELCGLMFPPLASMLHAAHCLLFMATRQGDFAIRCGHGKQQDALKKGFRISAAFKPTVFHAAIKNHVDVSIADVSKLKPTALVDGYAAMLPHVNKFVVLPIGNQRVGGLLYCDWEGSHALSLLELEATKKLRMLFLPYMAS